MRNETEAREAAFAALAPERAILGESPVWSAREGAIWWVDLDGRSLFRTVPGGETRRWPTPEMACFVQIRADGAPVVGMESGLFAFDAASGRGGKIAPIPHEGVRFNDSCIDSAGRLWAGTMDPGNARPIGALWLYGAEGAPERVLDGFLTINGLAWDAARERLYVSDSHPNVRKIWALEAPGGRPRPETRRLFADMAGLPGRPDGGAVDAEGCYWSAGVDGGELYRFAPDGALALRLRVPYEFPTKPAFGGPAHATMFLTSKADRGEGGRLAAAETGFRGLAAPEWRRAPERAPKGRRADEA